MNHEFVERVMKEIYGAVECEAAETVHTILRDAASSSDKWIRPDGKACPVGRRRTVEARLANGSTVTAVAESFSWEHGDPTCDDIIEYRIVDD